MFLFEKLKQHLNTFLNAYNFEKRLKTLKGLTPYEFIKDYWTQKPEAFKLKPTHLSLKLYTFVEASKDENIKNQVLLHASASAFSNPLTGFGKNQGVPLPLGLELTKIIKGSSDGS